MKRKSRTTFRVDANFRIPFRGSGMSRIFRKSRTAQTSIETRKPGRNAERIPFSPNAENADSRIRFRLRTIRASFNINSTAASIFFIRSSADIAKCSVFKIGII